MTHAHPAFSAHAVYGSGYAWTNSNLEIKKGDFVEFEWSTPPTVDGIAYRVFQVAAPGDRMPVSGGFVSSTESTANGTFDGDLTGVVTSFLF